MNPTDRTRPGDRLERGVGVVLLAHFGLQAWVKWDGGAIGEMLWLSNVALLMAAVGLLWGRVSAVAVALLWVGVPHAVWAIDFAGLAVTGESRLGVLAYWPASDAWVRLGTAYHLYLGPVLLAVIARRGVALRPWLPAAAVLFLVLAVLSRLLVAPALNVNWVYHAELRSGFGLIDHFNAIPDGVYLLALTAGMAVGAFAPTAIIVDAVTRAWQRRSSPRGVGNPATSATSTTPARFTEIDRGTHNMHNSRTAKPLLR